MKKVDEIRLDERLAIEAASAAALCASLYEKLPEEVKSQIYLCLSSISDLRIIAICANKGEEK